MELRNYETLFVLTPVLSQEQLQEAIDKFRTFLQEKKAEIVHEETMGLKKLAYPIQHKTTGVYQLFEFKATPDLIRVLETEYRRDERVIRFSTFALDKHAIDYNVQQRSGAKPKKTEPKQEVAA
ncbi:MAG: 30S ribosomal protein S6 [Bacteroidota bacterium]